MILAAACVCCKCITVVQIIMMGNLGGGGVKEYLISYKDINATEMA